MRSVKVYISFVILAFLICSQASALHITSYISPRNRERKTRRRTDYIVLHTTEGPKKGSLAKIYKNGEAHYLVDLEGRVYRIIDRKKIAYHAGRSMWQGKSNLDNYSVGIEVVGYHDKSVNSTQCKALKELLRDLQRIYRVPDDRVLAHSMVAYSSPNRWQSKACRGRKRCAMQFANKKLRRSIGLKKRPMYDPDVKAGRLVIADPYLARMLYGSVSSELTIQKENVSRSGSAWDLAGDKYNERSTMYILPDGSLKMGDEISDAEATSLPSGTSVLVGYEDGGVITKKNSAYDICGTRWNSASTIYRFPDGKILTGSRIKENSIPAGTRVYTKE